MGFDTIWRASLEPDKVQSFDAPIGAQVLSVKQRPVGGHLRVPFAEVWFRCNPEMDIGPLPVRLIGTDWPECPDTYFRFVDTVFYNAAREVYHVFVGDAWASLAQLSSHTVHLSHAERRTRGLGADETAPLALRERIDAYMPPPPPA